jgi:hypothetical protein
VGSVMVGVVSGVAAARPNFSKSRPCDTAAASAGCGCAAGDSYSSMSHLPQVGGMPVDWNAGHRIKKGFSVGFNKKQVQLH